MPICVIKFFELIETIFPACMTVAYRPRKREPTEFVDTLLRHAGWLAVLHLAILSSLPVDKCAQGWIRFVLEWYVNVAIFIFVFSKEFYPSVPR